MSGTTAKERARYSLGTFPCSHMTVKFSRLLPMPVAMRPWLGVWREGGTVLAPNEWEGSWGRINVALRKEVIFSACNRIVALREIKEEDWTGLLREKVACPPIALL